MSLTARKYKNDINLGGIKMFDLYEGYDKYYGVFYDDEQDALREMYNLDSDKK